MNWTNILSARTLYPRNGASPSKQKTGEPKLTGFMKGVPSTLWRPTLEGRRLFHDSMGRQTMRGAVKICV